VTVSLDNESTKTDDTGHFRFPEAAPGVHSVTISGSDFTPVGTEETLLAAHKYDATYDVDVPKEPSYPPSSAWTSRWSSSDTELDKIRRGGPRSRAESGRAGRRHRR